MTDNPPNGIIHQNSSKDLLKLSHNTVLYNYLSYPYDEYSIISATHSKKFNSTLVKPDNDPIIKLKKMIEELHHITDYHQFDNLQSLLYYFHETDQIAIQIVLEWINVFATQYNNYISKGYFISIEELFTSSKGENEEFLSLNGVNYYTSDMRNFIIKVLTKIAKKSLCHTEKNDSHSLKIMIVLYLIKLDYEKAKYTIKELSRIKNNNVKCLQMLYQCIDYQSIKYYTEFKDVIPKEYEILFTVLQHNFSFILRDESISLLLKLIIIFKYYSRQEIESCLKSIRNSYIRNGKIEAMILSIPKYSMLLIREYINNTDDLFSTYFISSFLNDNQEPVQLYQTIASDFTEVMNKMRLFKERLLLNQIIADLINKINTSRQNSINSQSEKEYFCYLCSMKMVNEKNSNRSDSNEYLDICSKCLGRFHSCSICRLPIDMEASSKGKMRSMVELEDNDDRLGEKTSYSSSFKFLWCSNCLHGGHLEEINKWFNGLSICPEANCSCFCLDYNHILL